MIRRISRYAGGLFPLEALITKSRFPFIVPLYHTISDLPLAHIDPIYTPRRIDTFRKDLDLFLKYFDPVSLDELCDSGRERHAQRPVFHITFDDGLSQVYEHALPILLSKGIPATVFVNTDFVDNKGLFYKYKLAILSSRLQRSGHNQVKLISSLLSERRARDLFSLGYDDQFSIIDKIAEILEVDFSDYLKHEKPYMSINQLADWNEKGMTIGGHSTDHQRYAEKSPESQLEDFLKCTRRIKEIFNIETKAYAFPFDDVGISKSTIEFMKEKSGVKTTFGISGLKKDYSQNHIHRVPMEKYQWPAKHLIRSEYFYYHVKKFLGKNLLSRS